VILQKALEGSTEMGRERSCRPFVRPQIDALDVVAGRVHALMAAEVSVRAVGLLVRLLGWVRGVGFVDVAEVDVQVGDGDGCRARAEDLE